MEKFQVPQFIEVEDKIFGPLTLKQFLYLAAGGGVLFLLFFVLNTIVWVVFVVLIGSVAAAFAFIKVNGHSFAKLLYLTFKYYWSPRLYLWQQHAPEAQEEESIEALLKEAPRTERKIEETKKIETPQRTAAPPQPSRARASIFQLPRAGKIKDLWQQLLTSRQKLSRERTPAEHYTQVRGLGGADVMVKRIDYR